jgi:hypothetical protein
MAGRKTGSVAAGLVASMNRIRATAIDGSGPNMDNLTVRRHPWGVTREGRDPECPI